METFTLTRKDMASLLVTLSGKTASKLPLQVLQDAWRRYHQEEIKSGSNFTSFLSTSLPPVLEKMIKSAAKVDGFSLHDIVALGSQIEYTHMSITSVQNWVKRDFKSYLGAPKEGKKYSLNQAALLFIIEDLKSTLDFESIRKLFDILFRDSATDEDDLIQPLELYSAYSTLFEEMEDHYEEVVCSRTDTRGFDAVLDQLYRQRAEHVVAGMKSLSLMQKEAVRNALIVALISVQTSYFHSLARRYVNGMVFLRDLE
ncbi:DUF1836 domain-containing protein [Paenibacillus sp. GCM10023252]|uniref:DUF1836 domain-containing protein n=1 Tax=Paenibacillus sp. GCM10023252 TaxID=3252649 RepID=UPI00360A3FFD